MPRIIYKTAEGEQFEANAFDGMTAMEAALLAGVPDILGLCGGICSCATCHVLVDDAWVDKVEPPREEEACMVEELENRHGNSRLGCQIMLGAELDGLILHVPAGVSRDT